MKLKQASYIERIVDYRIEYNSKVTPGSGYSFECDELGNIQYEWMDPRWWNIMEVQVLHPQNYEGPFIHDYSRNYKHQEVYECERCGGDAEFNRYCGAVTCFECNNHLGMARCYCGWSASGGNGYTELVEMGENIEPDW